MSQSTFFADFLAKDLILSNFLLIIIFLNFFEINELVTNSKKEYFNKAKNLANDPIEYRRIKDNTKIFKTITLIIFCKYFDFFVHVVSSTFFNVR